MKNVKEKLLSAKNKIMVAVPTALMIGTTCAHAEGESSDISTITGSVTTALSSAKTDFVTALGAVVGIAIGFFVVKFVVVQVIRYFKKVAN